MKKFPMLTERDMDEEERQVLVAILNGKYKTRKDIDRADDESPGLMADFAMLSVSGYVGWNKDGELILTTQGREAASVSVQTDASS